MNLTYFRESFSEYFCSKKQDQNLQHNNHSSNEPKIVLAFANYSGKLCNKSERRGNNILPLFGKMFSLN